jgi:hypothetical protein
MRIIDLPTAASEIVQAATEDGAALYPFVLVVGAGLSHPLIPLSAEISAHCKSVAAKYGRNTAPSSANPMDIYSHWFEQAYPQPSQRPEVPPQID